MLSQLEHLLSPKAAVSLRLLAGPDESTVASLLLTRILQPAMVFAMATNASVAFAKHGRLEARVELITLVSEELHRTPEEDDESNPMNDGPPAVKMRAFKKYVKWRLLPTDCDVDDQNTYHGLWPEYKAVRVHGNGELW